MTASDTPIYGVRTGHTRDRRGRGLRGPLALPGPLSPHGLGIQAKRYRDFDTFVIAVLEAHTPAIMAAGLTVEVAVEPAPLLPEQWTDPVPASILNQDGDRYTIVIYRLPITQRAQNQNETLMLVWEVLSHRVAEILGVDPEDLDV